MNTEQPTQIPWHESPTLVEASYTRNNLSWMLDAVLTGQSFTITRNGREVAQLSPVSAPAHGIDAGSGQGKLRDKIKAKHQSTSNEGL
jgi:prevent-host-death family protein